MFLWGVITVNLVYIGLTTVYIAFETRVESGMTLIGINGAGFTFDAKKVNPAQLTDAINSSCFRIHLTGAG